MNVYVYARFNFLCNFSDRKFYVVDGQNATLAGGVAMGAIANMLVQPYAALIIGSLAGLLSCYGYRVLQVMNTDEFNVSVR